jgi:uncharacterized membrane protein
MRSPYAKEGLGTVIFFVLYLIMGHTGLWLAPLTKAVDVTILGFPIHYFGAIILGWIGLIVVSLFYVRWAEKVDEEIESYDDRVDQTTVIESDVNIRTAKSVGE